MTDFDTAADASAGSATPRPTRAELDALRVPELRALAASLGVASVSTLRKGSLVDAITDLTASDDPQAAPPAETGTESGRTGDETAVDEQVGGAGDEPEGVAPEPVPPVELTGSGAEAEVEAVEPEAQQPEEQQPEAQQAEAVEPEAQQEPEVQEALPGLTVAGTDASRSEVAAERPGIAEVGVEVESADAPEADQPVGEVPADQVLDSAADLTPAAETAEARQNQPAPKAAADHTNAGLTGIAEDLEQLQRRETGTAPVEGQHDGTHPVDATEVESPTDAEQPVQTEQSEQTEGRGRNRRGRGRGGDRQQGQGQQQGQADGQQQNGQGQQSQGQQPRGQQGQGQQAQGQQAQNQQQGRQAAEGEQVESGRTQDRQQDRAQDRQQDRPGDDRQQEGRGRGRYRDRKRRGQGVDPDEPEINDDDVLIPIAGILDVLDNYAFVRTSGYLAGTNDVYVSLGQVKKYGLRRGDAVVGAVKQPHDGDGAGRQKYNAIVRIDSINGLPVAEAEERVEFGKLTPLYPQERLRLETDADKLTTRVVDLVAPIGKGQRGLIVSPPKAGKTLVLQAVANAITRNNPEVHLMVVLVDERPEEVTEMQRTVKGEVIASTFDRPAEDHTTVAELAIERAKRLVELGYDVVVLLDSITRLGRAYNQVVPASGRVLAGGVDAAALYPPKRFFGAARNIENGGSLTILATALVETGSRTDEVIFEEFKGTANMELRLSGELAEQRIFPAVDVAASGTRREEMLMGADEVRVTWQLRRALAGLDVRAAHERVLGPLKDSGSNAEFLVQTQKSLPAGTNGSGRGA